MARGWGGKGERKGRRKGGKVGRGRDVIGRRKMKIP
jgi:hypothetical protein